MGLVRSRGPEVGRNVFTVFDAVTVLYRCVIDIEMKAKVKDTVGEV